MYDTLIEQSVIWNNIILYTYYSNRQSDIEASKKCDENN